MNRPEHNQNLITCYLSEQMTERQWQEHLDKEPGLREAWAAHCLEREVERARRVA